MKKILTLLFYISTLYSFSQNPNLLDKRWFVENMFINGNGINIPTDHFDFPFTSLDFYNSNTGLIGSSNNIMKEDCTSGFIAHLTYDMDVNNQTTFQINDFTLSQTNTGCVTTQDTAMLSFMVDYNAFFDNNISNTFSYFILDVYGIDHLKITKPNGDHIWFTEIPNPFVNASLIENTWHLSKTIFNGIETIIPVLSGGDFNELSIDFKSYYLEHNNNNELKIQDTFQLTACSLSKAMLNLYPTSNTFYLYSLSSTLSSCGVGNITNYNDSFIQFFTNNLPGTFSYSIIEQNGVRELTITNTIGDQTIYETTILGVFKKELNKFKIYPNPTKKMVHIIDINSTIKSVKLYTVLGQEVVSTTLLDLDISTLGNGYYFIKILFENGENITEKIIKQ